MKTGLVTAALLGAFLALLVLVLASASHVTLPVMNGRTLNVVGEIITIVAVAQTFALLAGLTAVAVSDVRARKAVAPLFWPLTLAKASLTALLFFTAVNSLDLILHDQRPEWTAGREPEVRFLGVALFLVLTSAFCWQLAVILRGRGWSGKAVTLAYALGSAAVTLVLVLAFRM